MSAAATLPGRQAATRTRRGAKSSRTKPGAKPSRGRGVGVVFVAAVVGLALVAGLFLAVFPLTTLFDQRSEMSETQAQLDRLRAENAELQARSDALANDQEIERLARSQYNLVRPGEVAIALLPAPEGAVTTTTVPDPLPTDPDQRSLVERLSDEATFWTP